MQRVLMKCVKLGIPFIIAIAAVKILLVGYDVDEQYAISMSYRLLQGDLLVAEMWEPHQTSAFLLALLMYPYDLIVGNLTGIVLYLRICGLLMHGLVSICLYRHLTKYIFKDWPEKEEAKVFAFLIVCVQFFSLPKLMFLPEFSNMQVWFLLLTVLSFHKYLLLREEKKGTCHLLLAGFWVMLEVLTYPSTFFVFAFLVLFMLFSRKSRFSIKEVVLFVAPGVLGFLLFFAYLLRYIQLQDLGQYISYILDDGSHGATWSEKLLLNIRSVGEILLYLTVYGLIALFCGLIVRNIKFLKEISPFFRNAMLLLVITFAGQMVIWLFGNKYPNYPSVEYFFVLGMGFIFALKEKLFKDREVVLFLLTPLMAFAGILAFTNHPVLVSAPFLNVCVTGILIMLVKYGKNQSCKKIILKAVFALWILMLLFGKTYLVRVTGGVHYPVFDSVYLIEEGPAKGIIGDYTAVFGYNERLQIVKANIPEGAKVFYAGECTDVYLLGNAQVCTPSTISTPTFNQRIEEYFKLHPEKLPEYIICDCGLVDFSTDSWLMNYVRDNCHLQPLAENDYLVIFEMKQKSE